jgi:2-dehydropantoate 2-reductase
VRLSAACGGERIRNRSLETAALAGRLAIVAERLEFVDNLPAEIRASMAVDLIAGRRLELPWLSGAVVRKGAELGIPTPANAFVCKALKLDVMGTPH